MSFKYFNVKNGLTTGNISLHSANANVQANYFLGNISVTSLANLGNVGNVIITGGTNGYVLQTDGTGNLSWASQGGSIASISNGTSNVNIPTVNGNINFSSAGNANVVVITGTGANISGTANITGNLVVGNITAGAGSGGNITGGNVISTNTFIALTSANFVAASNVNLGVVGNIKITGGTSSYVLSTDGTGNLSWVAQSGGGSSTISNGNSNVNIPSANGNVNISAVGNANVVVITGTGANISGTANITGNLVAGNITAGAGSGGNITGGNVISANTFTASGNITSGNANLGNEVTANFFIGTLTTAAQPNVTSVGTLTSLAVTGNTTSGNLIGPLANGNSNVYIPSANGNINLTAVGNTTLVITGTGANITGTANITGNLVVGNITAGAGSGGNITGGNVISANTFTASGNITSGNDNLGNLATANFFSGSGNNLSNISGGNVTGQVGNALVAGTVYTNAQPNITSTGSLTGLTVSNATGVVNFTTTANVTLGAVANLHISGGTNGYVLSTDGAGVLTWVAQGGGIATISNGNSNVNIPSANGNINFSTVGNANVVVITGTGANVTGTLNVTGQSNLGAVGNVVITGGTANYILNTDGAGNLSWVAPPASANVTVDNFTGNGVQTIFTLSTTPIGINQTSVNYNGATVLRTDYTLANANITFSSAPANGSYIEVTTINLTAGGGGGTSAAAAVGYSLIFGG